MIFGPGKWTVTPEARPAATLRLLCFHHAGGGAYGFRSWVPHLRRDVELVAVQLPGRENRFSEPPEPDVQRLFDGLIPALKSQIAGPYAIFGHSMGARLGLALARRVVAGGELAPPERLIMSGARPPTGPPSRPAEARPPATDDELIETLTRLGGTPPALLEDRRLLGAFLPALRADMALNDELRRQIPQPLDMPFTVLGGAADPGATPAQLEAWSALTTGHTRHHTFPGGHFFTQTSLPAVLETINHALGAATRSQRADSTALNRGSIKSDA
jgi:medium-chain acyl-[acyl-carrier-protein] hydrolase